MPLTTPHAFPKGLRRALAANGAFSTTCGLLLLTPVARPVTAWLGAAATVGLGLGLCAFGAFVLLQARRPTLDARAVRAITAADFGWLAGTAVLLALRPPSAPLWLLVALANAVVLTCALHQRRGLQRAHAA